MLIYVMLAIFIITTIILYFKFEKDILEPAVIFSAMYTFSILCATINVNNWGIDLTLETFLIIVLGGAEFILISIIINRYYKKRNESKSETIIDEEKKENKSGIITIEKWKIIIILIYSIITIVLLIKNILLIASNFGEYSTFSEALTIFRQNTSYSTNASLSKIVLLMLKPIFACAYICLFIYINNIIYREGKIYKNLYKESIYLIPVIAYIIQSLVQSNRGSVIRIVIAAFVIFVIIWYKKNNWSKKIKFQTIIILVLVACIGLGAFYLMGTIIGRKISKNIVEYITMYCGGSIQCFDLYIREPAEKTDIFRI